MRLTDPLAMRALAHPLRLDLVELLALIGPATAATCARELGTSQATCSFHLRQLAKYGFVEEAEPSTDRRERLWRLVDLEQSWSGEEDPAAQQLDRVFVQREAERVIGWMGRKGNEQEPWRSSGFFGGATVPLTADELAGIRNQLRAALEPYVGRLTNREEIPASARFVRVLLGATPLDRTPPDHTPLDHTPGDHTPGDHPLDEELTDD